MEYIQVTRENIENEHICCAISNNKDIQVSSKKAWMNKCFNDGLTFIKSTERGKCFIEYVPAENAWVPIVAPGYMYIDCFWVSGSFKGHGYSNDLLNKCIEDSKAKGKVGLCILSSAKRNRSFQTLNILHIRDLKLLIFQMQVSILCIYHLMKMQKFHSLKNVLNILILMKWVMYCTLQINVLLMESMYRSLKNSK